MWCLYAVCVLCVWMWMFVWITRKPIAYIYGWMDKMHVEKIVCKIKWIRWRRVVCHPPHFFQFMNIICRSANGCGAKNKNAQKRMKKWEVVERSFVYYEYCVELIKIHSWWMNDKFDGCFLIRVVVLSNFGEESPSNVWCGIFFANCWKWEGVVKYYYV